MADQTRPKAIITGSDSGIGKATAVALAQRGVDVGITWHRDDAGAASTVEEARSLGAHAAVRQLDLDDLPGAAAVVDELADALGGLDVLVNNAGTGHSEPLVDHAFDAWQHVLRVDLDGAFLCAQRAARRMIDAGRGGVIVNVTSVHEHVPLHGSAAYCAAKGADGHPPRPPGRRPRGRGDRRLPGLAGGRLPDRHVGGRRRRDAADGCGGEPAGHHPHGVSGTLGRRRRVARDVEVAQRLDGAGHVAEGYGSARRWLSATARRETGRMEA